LDTRHCYDKYLVDREGCYRLQHEAQSTRRGLWVDQSPVKAVGASQAKAAADATVKVAKGILFAGGLGLKLAFFWRTLVAPILKQKKERLSRSFENLELGRVLYHV